MVVTSHNPESIPSGCGRRWATASTLDPPYLLVIDDDMLLWPTQVARLYERLLEDPGVPHGLSGLVQTVDRGFTFITRRDGCVDYLCEAYAVTRDHLRRYAALLADEQVRLSASLMVDTAHDFAVISATGDGRPRIHDVGRIHRCRTHVDGSVAVHRSPTFWSELVAVSAALRNAQAS
jgi:hypothetical protein